jgi:hypothetical protein
MLEPQHRVSGRPVYFESSETDPANCDLWSVVVHVPAELFARFDDESGRKDVERVVSDLASHIRLATRHERITRQLDNEQDLQRHDEGGALSRSSRLQEPSSRL